ncbi:hypothetical protein EV562_102163 [Streptomyces sp. BK208]|uniref:hypothetical protein n=1 Tax=Streptomyces sp. BK208 TaxID=2512150 RepID=UPI00105C03D1|nr:hypothetical protein [Streptomyces sp. BK208]TDT40779.1 hypothetical protein EV562_102163 [Streptomyces sp. BK208]
MDTDVITAGAGPSGPLLAVASGPLVLVRPDGHVRRAGAAAVSHDLPEALRRRPRAPGAA